MTKREFIEIIKDKPDDSLICLHSENEPKNLEFDIEIYFGNSKHNNFICLCKTREMK